MKQVSNDYKTKIKQYGRQLNSIITYTENGQSITLGANKLNAVTPSFEGSILKSVMKELVIDSNEDIPLETEINYQFGVMTDETNGTYEYIDFGNYIVYKSEKKEDTESYEITCYDKMLYAMKPYESLEVNYPITIRNYITALCTKLGLTFANSSDTFTNYDKEIPNELYLNDQGNDIGYTYRDVLDEIAQATASTICINNNDELEIRYISSVDPIQEVETIDGKSFKDTNVNFGKKYGPVNSIVLSRADSDNVYLQDEESVAQNGLCEIKIIDNQIMNGNDRDEYLEGILDTLDGLEYYTNDFASTGITFLELCDRYNVEIGEKTYPCIMFNDEILVTQGLEENIHANMPEDSETDYTKADKTDRKINQTTLIVDKHEQEINALISKVVDLSDTEENVGSVTLEDAHAGILHKLEIRGSISNIFPSNSVKTGIVPYQNQVPYPSATLYPKDSYLQVDETLYKLDIDFLNYINETIYDKYVYEEGKQWIERNIGIDPEGNMYPLDEAIIEEKPDVYITVESDSTLTLLSHSNGILRVEYLLENQYTDVFATHGYVDSGIKIASDSINAEVKAKVDENEIVAKLNLGIENGQGIVELKGNSVIIDSDNFTLDETGKITATSGDIAGFTMDGTNGFEYKIYAPYYYDSSDLLRIRQILLEIVTPTPEDYERYDLNHNGQIDAIDYIRVLWFVTEQITPDNYGKFTITLPRDNRLNSATTGYLNGNGELIAGFNFNSLYGENLHIRYDNTETITAEGQTGNITCVSLTQTSQEQNKKNFEKYEDSALKEIQNIDIYKYNLKSESNEDKKHLGFVISDKFKYSKQVTNNANNGVDNYSFTSLLCKAIQEQQEQIEELKKEIKTLKGGKNND